VFTPEKMNDNPFLASSLRTCSRCGGRFAAFAREYVCPDCRKPNSRVAKGLPPCTRLTFREQQIVDLVGRARSNKEIAFQLCLTEGTVKEYLYHIFRKLNVTNRTELALRCQLNPVEQSPNVSDMKRGIIPGPPEISTDHLSDGRTP
jgi:DNA-binding NarL/FixJ family response regulator